MNSTGQLDSNQDLMFFGKVNAVISHELKNILAIISETAGLMTDLLELAAKGKKVDTDTLLGCGRDIVDEIQRGFATVKVMNRFSHTADDVLAEVDIDETLALLVGIVGFLSFAGPIRTDDPPRERRLVRTSPFRLQHLFYEVVTAMFKAAGPNGEVRITPSSGAGGAVQVAFAVDHPATTTALPMDRLAMIADSIKIKLDPDDDGRTLYLTIPLSLEPSACRS